MVERLSSIASLSIHDTNGKVKEEEEPVAATTSRLRNNQGLSYKKAPYSQDPRESESEYADEDDDDAAEPGRGSLARDALDRGRIVEPEDAKLGRTRAATKIRFYKLPKDANGGAVAGWKKWTAREDAKLRAARKIRPRLTWVQIAVQFAGERTYGACEGRWRTLHPGGDDMSDQDEQDSDIHPDPDGDATGIEAASPIQQALDIPAVASSSRHQVVAAPVPSKGQARPSKSNFTIEVPPSKHKIEANPPKKYVPIPAPTPGFTPLDEAALDALEAETALLERQVRLQTRKRDLAQMLTSLSTTPSTPKIEPKSRPVKVKVETDDLPPPSAKKSRKDKGKGKVIDLTGDDSDDE